MNIIQIQKTLIMLCFHQLRLTDDFILEIHDNKLVFKSSINSLLYMIMNNVNSKRRKCINISTIAKKKIIINKININHINVFFKNLEKININEKEQTLLFYDVDQREIYKMLVNIEEIKEKETNQHKKYNVIKQSLLHQKLNTKILRHTFQYFNKMIDLSRESMLEFSNKHISFTNNIEWIHLVNKDISEYTNMIVLFDYIDFIWKIIALFNKQEIFYFIDNNLIIMYIENIILNITIHKKTIRDLNTTSVYRLLKHTQDQEKCIVSGDDVLYYFNLISNKHKLLSIKDIKYHTKWCVRDRYLEILYYNSEYVIDKLMIPIKHQIVRKISQFGYFNIKTLNNILKKLLYKQQEIQFIIHNNTLFIFLEVDNITNIIIIKGKNIL